MKIRPIQQKLKTTDYGARAAVTAGEVGSSGVVQVVLTLSAEDAFGIPSVLCHLKLSRDEAKRIAEALTKAAQEATP